MCYTYDNDCAMGQMLTGCQFPLGQLRQGLAHRAIRATW